MYWVIWEMAIFGFQKYPFGMILSFLQINYKQMLVEKEMYVTVAYELVELQLMLISSYSKVQVLFTSLTSTTIY